MKILKSLSVIIISSIVLASCGGNSTSESTVSATDSVKLDTAVTAPVTQESAVSENDNQNWDKVLDDYEKFATDYVKFYKKALKGDQTALTEYPKIMEQATNLSESLQKAQTNNKLSAKQIARMTDIATKMTNAALGK